MIYQMAKMFNWADMSVAERSSLHSSMTISSSILTSPSIPCQKTLPSCSHFAQSSGRVRCSVGSSPFPLSERLT